MAAGSAFHVARERGKAVAIGNRVLTPIALVLRVGGNRRGFAGGFAWVRPLAVEVAEAGQTHTLPIVDVGVLTGVALGVVGALVATQARRSR